MATTKHNLGANHSRTNVPLCFLAREIGGCRKATGPSMHLELSAEEQLISRDHEEFECVFPEVARSTFLMVFSADRKLIASTHGNRNVYVSDLTTGRHIKTLTGHPRTPWCIAFHPSTNQILASGCLGGQVRVWDLHGGSEIWTADSETVIASLTFHPTDHVLVIASYNEVLFWDWSKEKPFAKCSTSNDREKVRYVSFDRYGHKLITGIGNAPKLNSQWDRVGTQPPTLPTYPEQEGIVAVYYRYMVEQYERLVERYVRLSNLGNSTSPSSSTGATRTSSSRPRQTMDRGTDPMDSNEVRSGTRCSVCRESLVDSNPSCSTSATTATTSTHSSVSSRSSRACASTSTCSSTSTSTSTTTSTASTSTSTSEQPSTSSRPGSRRRGAPLLEERRRHSAGTDEISASYSSSHLLSRILRDRVTGLAQPSPERPSIDSLERAVFFATLAYQRNERRRQVRLIPDQPPTQEQNQDSADSDSPPPMEVPSESNTPDTSNPPLERTFRDNLLIIDNYLGNMNTERSVRRRMENPGMLMLRAQFRRLQTMYNSRVRLRRSLEGVEGLPTNRESSETSENEVPSLSYLSALRRLPAQNNNRPGERPSPNINRAFGSESRLFGNDSRPFGSESRLFGSDSRPFGSDSRPLGSDNRPSAFTPTPSSSSHAIPSDNLANVHLGIQLVNQHIENIANENRTNLEDNQIERIRELWDLLQEQIRTLQREVREMSGEGSDSNNNSSSEAGTSPNSLRGPSPNTSSSLIEVSPPGSSVSSSSGGSSRCTCHHCIPTSRSPCRDTGQVPRSLVDDPPPSNSPNSASTVVRIRISPVAPRRTSTPVPNENTPSASGRNGFLRRRLCPFSTYSRALFKRPKFDSDSRNSRPDLFGSCSRTSPVVPSNRNSERRSSPQQSETQNQQENCEPVNPEQPSTSAGPSSLPGAPSSSGTPLSSSSSSSSTSTSESSDQQPRSEGRCFSTTFFHPSGSACRSTCHTHQSIFHCHLHCDGPCPRNTLSGNQSNTRPPTLDRPSNTQNRPSSSVRDRTLSSWYHDAVRNRARHVLPIMVEGLTQFFENDPTSLNAEESTENFNQRISSLINLLGLALNLSGALLTQLDRSRRERLQQLRWAEIQEFQALRRGAHSSTGGAVPSGSGIQENGGRNTENINNRVEREENVEESEERAPRPMRLGPPLLRVNDLPVLLDEVPASVSPPTNPPPPPNPLFFPQVIRPRIISSRNNPLLMREGDGAFELPQPSNSPRPRYLHPRYFPPLYIGDILDNEIKVNPKAPLHRIQAWDFTKFALPEIHNPEKNLVVSECKIHNDASVDVSNDGNVLVTLLAQRFNVSTMLGVYSLNWKSLGQCLYTTSFDQSAVSVSLSPTSRHLIVGLASKRISFYQSEKQTIAKIYELEKLKGEESGKEGEVKPGTKGTLVLVRDLKMSREPTDYVSLNCIRWAPTAGEGFVYATNAGKLKILR